MCFVIDPVSFPCSGMFVGLVVKYELGKTVYIFVEVDTGVAIRDMWNSHLELGPNFMLPQVSLSFHSF